MVSVSRAQQYQDLDTDWVGKFCEKWRSYRRHEPSAGTHKGSAADQVSLPLRKAAEESSSNLVGVRNRHA